LNFSEDASESTQRSERIRSFAINVAGALQPIGKKRSASPAANIDDRGRKAASGDRLQFPECIFSLAGPDDVPLVRCPRGSRAFCFWVRSGAKKIPCSGRKNSLLGQKKFPARAKQFPARVPAQPLVRTRFSTPASGPSGRGWRTASDPVRPRLSATAALEGRGPARLGRPRRSLGSSARSTARRCRASDARRFVTLRRRRRSEPR
jgi:hypothetical protein